MAAFDGARRALLQRAGNLLCCYCFRPTVTPVTEINHNNGDRGENGNAVTVERVEGGNGDGNALRVPSPTNPFAFPSTE